MLERTSLEAGGRAAASRSGAASSLLPLTLLALAATLIRAIEATRDQILFNDGPRFIAIADKFLHGDFAAALRDEYHPLTSLVMAGISAVAGIDLEHAGLVASVASGALGSIALYLLARAQFGPRAAWVAGLIFAVHPRMVDVGSDVQSDGIHLAMVLLAALGCWRALEERRLAPALGGGLASGLAYLARPEGLGVGLVTGAWLLVDLVRRRVSPARGLVLGGALALGMALAAGPYLAWLHSIEGHWVLTRKKSLTALTSPAPAPVDPALLADPVGATPPPAARGWGERSAEAIGDLCVDGLRAAHPLLLVLGVIGLVGRRTHRATHFVLSYAGLMAVVLFWLHLSASYVAHRHWLTVVVLLLPFYALGLIAVVSSVERIASSPWTLPGAAAVLAIALLLQSVLPEASPAKLARHEAATWIRQHGEGRAVAAHRARDAYYSGTSRFIPLPQTRDPRALLEQVRRQGADYVLLDEARLGGLSPERLAGMRETHRVPYRGGAVLVLEVSPE